MATPAQLDEKRPRGESKTLPKRGIEGIAIEAQLAEKARRDRDGAGSYTSFPTPAQLSETALRDAEGTDQYASFATPAQMMEKASWNRDDTDSYAPFATPAQLAEKTRGRPPPLPPRASSVAAPPPYTSDDAKRNELMSKQWRSHDPRSSSTHSLVPAESQRGGKRTLLLVYIHGFMGNETSFQSFPAHVHNLVTIAVAETHVVHTKIYPRYKSRRAIEFARDDFSTWLEPHEDDNTDVVLIGHSMGGILAAEVALQKPRSPTAGRAFQNRILGTINLDTTFLGMHPGVISSGIGSLFRPAAEPPKPVASGMSTASSTQTPLSSPGYASSLAETDSSSVSRVPSITSPLASPPPNDPFFNPPFPNDVRLPERKGWNNLLHFVSKHSDNLTSSTKQYFMSHLEFGGCLADYSGLQDRYRRLRALEDVNDAQQSGTGNRPEARRIRFINYYTASTGRPKPPKVPPGHVLDKDGQVQPIDDEMQELSLQSSSTHSLTATTSTSIEAHGAEMTPQPNESKVPPIQAQMENLGENSGVQEDQEDSEELPPMRHIDSIPIADDEGDDLYSASVVGETTEETEEPRVDVKTTEPALPPIPDPPTAPEPIDLNTCNDEDERKVAEKAYKRVMKAYQQAVKDREDAIKDRNKLIEKREKKAKQEHEKARKEKEKQKLKEQKDKEKQKQKEEKEEEKRRLKEEKEEQKRLATVNPESRERQQSVAASTKSEKPKRDKKFCMLPSTFGGGQDKCWVRVYMEGVDEVGAHCGLFFPGPQYESLVNDVGERIRKWVEEDVTRRECLGR